MRPRTALPALFSLSLAALGVSFAGPAAAQDARACSNEVQRLSEGFPATTSGQAPAGGIAQQPGTRQGAGMTETQQRAVRDALQQARGAGDSGNGALCMQNLNQARTLLRQAGVGSPVPGGAGVAGQEQPADRAPNLQGTEAPPDQRGLSTGTTGVAPGAPGSTGGPLSGTGAPNAQGAETPASPPMATPPRRNTRDSAVSPGGTGSSTTRGTTGGAGGATGGSSGGSSGGGGGGR
jgi:hypothetical protein